MNKLDEGDLLCLRMIRARCVKQQWYHEAAILRELEKKIIGRLNNEWTNEILNNASKKSDEG